MDTRLLQKPKSFDGTTDNWVAGAVDSRLKQAKTESEVLRSNRELSLARQRPTSLNAAVLHVGTAL